MATLLISVSNPFLAAALGLFFVCTLRMTQLNIR